MGNYIEYNDPIAFRPGYYIKELVDESGLTQEDFAKRLDTTPKNLSLLIRGEQSLSMDIAMKRREKYLSILIIVFSGKISGCQIYQERKMNK